MIAIIKGEVVDKNINSIIVDIGGIGYEIIASRSDVEAIELNHQVFLHVYDYLRESTHDLYGFVKKDDKYLFEKLLGVKNIGPKVALSVMDMGTDNVKTAIASGDVKALQSAKGVGKRAAEQMIVELRDKIGAISTEGAEEVVSRGGINQSDEAMQALIALGFGEADAHQALTKIDKSLSTEDRVKEALKGNNRHGG